MSKRFKVGQQVIRAYRGGYGDKPVEFENLTVIKVGTKYVTTANGRGWEERFDGKSGKGVTYRDREINRICESREAFEKEEADAETRRRFARAMSRWSLFDSQRIPVENIKQAAELLGLKLEEW
jgi:hypothetical protein